MAVEATMRGSSKAWLRVFQILGLIFGLYAIVSDVELAARELGRDPLSGTLGVLDRPSQTVQVASTVVRLLPNGPMARAGVNGGDLIRFDHPMDDFRTPRPNELVGFSRGAGGQWVHQSVRADAAKATAAPDARVIAMLFYTLAYLAASLIGMFILWRGGGQLTVLLLGLGLVIYGLVSAIPQALFSNRDLFAALEILGGVSFVAIPWCFYAFALGFFRDQGGSPSRREVWVFWLFGLILPAPAFATTSYFLTLRPVPLLGDGLTAISGLTLVGFGACLAYLTRGWRISSRETRRRYALLIVATLAVLISQLMDALTTTLHFPDGPWFFIYRIGNAILTGIVASGLYVYAILRQKVFDLGFAVSRTLVYGVVSAVLLAGFGLVEWAADHFLPVGGREKNALIDAVVALTIFLTFHRLRAGAERLIEALFFRDWREKEAALQAFLGEAPYFVTPGALTRAAVRVIGHYADGAATAIYLRDETGSFGLAEGRLAGLGARIDADDQTLVALRARRRTLADEAITTLPGAALVLPMLNRAEVTGVILVGEKPTGLGFRPDEIALLSRAAHEIGLDLQALKLEQLQSLASRLAIEKATRLGQGEALSGAAG